MSSRFQRTVRRATSLSRQSSVKQASLGASVDEVPGAAGADVSSSYIADRRRSKSLTDRDRRRTGSARTSAKHPNLGRTGSDWVLDSGLSSVDWWFSEEELFSRTLHIIWNTLGEPIKLSPASFGLAPPTTATIRSRRGSRSQRSASQMDSSHSQGSSSEMSSALEVFYKLERILQVQMELQRSLEQLRRMHASKRCADHRGSSSSSTIRRRRHRSSSRGRADSGGSKGGNRGSSGSDTPSTPAFSGLDPTSDPAGGGVGSAIPFDESELLRCRDTMNTLCSFAQSHYQLYFDFALFINGNLPMLIGMHDEYSKIRSLLSRVSELLMNEVFFRRSHDDDDDVGGESDARVVGSEDHFSALPMHATTVPIDELRCQLGTPSVLMYCLYALSRLPKYLSLILDNGGNEALPQRNVKILRDERKQFDDILNEIEKQLQLSAVSKNLSSLKGSILNGNRMLVQRNVIKLMSAGRRRSLFPKKKTKTAMFCLFSDIIVWCSAVTGSSAVAAAQAAGASTVINPDGTLASVSGISGSGFSSGGSGSAPSFIPGSGQTPPINARLLGFEGELYETQLNLHQSRLWKYKGCFHFNAAEFMCHQTSKPIGFKFGMCFSAMPSSNPALNSSSATGGSSSGSASGSATSGSGIGSGSTVTGIGGPLSGSHENSQSERSISGDSGMSGAAGSGGSSTPGGTLIGSSAASSAVAHQSSSQTTTTMPDEMRQAVCDSDSESAAWVQCINSCVTAIPGSKAWHNLRPLWDISVAFDIYRFFTAHHSCEDGILAAQVVSDNRACLIQCTWSVFGRLVTTRIKPEPPIKKVESTKDEIASSDEEEGFQRIRRGSQGSRGHPSASAAPSMESAHSSREIRRSSTVESSRHFTDATLFSGDTSVESSRPGSSAGRVKPSPGRVHRLLSGDWDDHAAAISRESDVGFQQHPQTLRKPLPLDPDSSVSRLVLSDDEYVASKSRRPSMADPDADGAGGSSGGSRTMDASRLLSDSMMTSRRKSVSAGLMASNSSLSADEYGAFREDSRRAVSLGSSDSDNADGRPSSSAAAARARHHHKTARSMGGSSSNLMRPGLSGGGGASSDSYEDAELFQPELAAVSSAKAKKRRSYMRAAVKSNTELRSRSASGRTRRMSASHANLTSGVSGRGERMMPKHLPMDMVDADSDDESGILPIHAGDFDGIASLVPAVSTPTTAAAASSSDHVMLIEQWKSMAVERQREAEKLKMEKSELSEKVDRLKKDKEQLKDELRDTRRKCDDLESANKSQVIEIDDLKKRVQSLLNDLADAKEAIALRSVRAGTPIAPLGSGFTTSSIANTTGGAGTAGGGGGGPGTGTTTASQMRPVPIRAKSAMSSDGRERSLHQRHSSALSGGSGSHASISDYVKSLVKSPSTPSGGISTVPSIKSVTSQRSLPELDTSRHLSANNSRRGSTEDQRSSDTSPLFAFTGDRDRMGGSPTAPGASTKASPKTPSTFGNHSSSHDTSSLVTPAGTAGERDVGDFVMSDEEEGLISMDEDPDELDRIRALTGAGFSVGSRGSDSKRTRRNSGSVIEFQTGAEGSTFFGGDDSDEDSVVGVSVTARSHSSSSLTSSSTAAATPASAVGSSGRRNGGAISPFPGGQPASGASSPPTPVYEHEPSGKGRTFRKMMHQQRKKEDRQSRKRVSGGIGGKKESDVALDRLMKQTKRRKKQREGSHDSSSEMDDGIGGTQSGGASGLDKRYQRRSSINSGDVETFYITDSEED